MITASTALPSQVEVAFWIPRSMRLGVFLADGDDEQA
jgi:hypothetical protein